MLCLRFYKSFGHFSTFFLWSSRIWTMEKCACFVQILMYRKMNLIHSWPIFVKKPLDRLNCFLPACRIKPAYEASCSLRSMLAFELSGTLISSVNNFKKVAWLHVPFSRALYIKNKRKTFSGTSIHKNWSRRLSQEIGCFATYCILVVTRITVFKWTTRVPPAKNAAYKRHIFEIPLLSAKR